MQPTSDKTFHLKWNNHLQNLSQLFTAIYSSSALADVTLSCRDGAIRAHKLVLSACSPYFEQIFRDNPCKHPVIILKGIPYAEINLLVEFMYKGSVDVQEIDLQSLMHTASELEVRGLAYELRKDASSLLNVNLNEYPTYAANQNQENTANPTIESVSHISNTAYDNTSTPNTAFQTNLERLHQIHLYQQSMRGSYSQGQGLASEIKRKRKNDDAMPANTTTAVKNILAAAAKELAEKKDSKPKLSALIQTEEETGENMETCESDSGENDATAENDDPLHNRDTRFKGKKRVSIGDEYPIVPRAMAKTKQGRKNIKLAINENNPSVGINDDCEDALSRFVITAVGGGSEVPNKAASVGTLKCVKFEDLRDTRDESVTVIDDDDSSAVDTSDENNLLVEPVYESVQGHEEEYDSSDSKLETAGPKVEPKVYKCDLCSLSFGRNYHLERHRRTHTGERPFRCDDCPFSFSRSSHLARHRRTHTGERPYRCEACGRTFTRGDKLKLHLRICEKDEYVLPSHQSHLNSSDPNKEIKKDVSQAMMSGMVSIGHSERHQLMFTSAGDVLLAPRAMSDSMVDINSSAASEMNESNQSSLMMSDVSSKLNLSMLNSPSTSDIRNLYSRMDPSGFPIKRGRGRPRKKPLPVVMPLIKKKRGRPPKIIKLDPTDPNGRPVENYNVSNLPYGDFSYLTDILSTHLNSQAYQNMLQMNPMLDNSKFLNVINNPLVQSSSLSMLGLNPTQMNVDPKPQSITQEVKSAVTHLSSNKDNIQKSGTSVNNVVDSSVKSPQIVNNSGDTPSVPEIENDPVTDLTSDREEIGDNEEVNSDEKVNDTDEQIPRINDCQISKVLNATTINKMENSSVLPTIGECTIKPILKNE